MSSDEPRNPEKTLEEVSEDAEMEELLAGVRNGGPPKFHPKVQADAVGANAAQYAHGARKPNKARDTLREIAPVLVNVTPPPERTAAAPPVERPEPPAGDVPQGRNLHLHVDRDENVSFETAAGIRRTKNIFVTLALAAAAALLIVLGIVAFRRESAPVGLAPATPAVSTPPATVPNVAPPPTPASPPEATSTQPASEDLMAMAPKRAPAATPAPKPVATVVALPGRSVDPPPMPVKTSTATPRSSASSVVPPAPLEVPGLEDLVPPTRPR